MIKEIKYNGHTANPSDYENIDGDLAMSIGVVPEDGALKPVLPPSEVLELQIGETVMFIHSVQGDKHYIIMDANGRLNWMKSVGTQTLLRTFESNIYQIEAVGNTLVVLAPDGVHYFLWKGNVDEYLYLGTKIPELPISFGLKSEIASSGDDIANGFRLHLSSSDGSEFIDTEDTYYENIYGDFDDKTKEYVSDIVLAHVNKLIQDKSVKAGKFLYPFFVRYAYRLFDGTLIKHSAPILMVCATGTVPVVETMFTKLTPGMQGVARCLVHAMVHTLDYAIVNPSDIANLQYWSDIVNSVDIFISAPLYTYDQNGLCSKFVDFPSIIDDDNENNPFSISQQTDQTIGTSAPLYYQKNHFMKMFYMSGRTLLNNSSYKTVKLVLPSKKQDMGNSSAFYWLKSIKISELPTTRTSISPSPDLFAALVNREVMTDDYDSHDSLIGKLVFTYNSRLNIANLKKRLFSGFNSRSLFCHTDGYVAFDSDGSYFAATGATTQIICKVQITQNGVNVVAEGDGGLFSSIGNSYYFYYPNINAHTLHINASSVLPKAIPLERHPFLNGAYCFLDWTQLTDGGTVGSLASGDNTNSMLIDMPNKIYTSEVNNPFIFPVLGINTVGLGDILGIRSAIKTLSQGQFGQFPLYAFTTEGIWALEVSPTGTYSTKQPVARDVCVNANSITQIDSAVLFATKRGIMLISGSTTQCITDSINAAELFSIVDLPKHDGFMSVFNNQAYENEKLVLGDIALLPFSDFLASCRMIYDYTYQRIIVYNPNVRYAYVYSLKTQAWGMMISDIKDGVNFYPEALAMATKKKTTVDDGIATTSDVPVLVDFTMPSADDITALVVTRPFTLGDPNIFKTIDTIIQRGLFKRENIQQVLYGSNDLYNWHAVWSSSDKFLRGFRGSPYKSFRIAIVAKLNKSESLLGCTVQFNPRIGNQPR